MKVLLSTKTKRERGKCKFLFALILLTCLLLPTQNIFAQTTYATFNSETQTVTIGYGSTIPDGATEINAQKSNDDWLAQEAAPYWNVAKVVFDESFAKFKPTSCKYWFASMDITEIEGLKYVNTEDVTDMHMMFYGCSELNSLDLSSFNTAKVTDMSSMFGYCSKLKTIFVSEKFSTASVTESEKMFLNCNKLYGGNGTHYEESDIKYARIDADGASGYFTLTGTTPFAAPVLYGYLSNWDSFVIGYGNTIPQGAEEIDENVASFSWIGKPTNANIQNLKIITIDESVKEYKPITTRFWFNGLNNITEIKGLTYLNTENVNDMSYMFYGCTKLQKLDLSSFDTKNVESMASMFYNCSFLKTIFVSDKWDVSSVTGSTYMFNNCHKLYGGNGTHYEKSDIQYACIDAEGTPGYLTKVGTAPFVAPTTYGVYNNSTETLTLYYGTNIPVNDYTQEIDPQKSNSYWLGNEFQYYSIRKVVIDKSFKDFKPTTCYSWFSGCNAIEISGLENINTENVTDMTNMFKECQYIKTLDLSNFNTQKVERMNSMFSYCSNLKTIFVSDKWTTAGVTTQTSMFTSCPKLYGGKGTHCEDADIKYACIDAEGTPGYFTKSGDKPFVIATPWAVFNSTTKVLTIGFGSALPANAVEINTELNWNGYLCSEIPNVKSAQKIIIDKSFADFQPTKCQNWFYNYSYVTEYEGLNNINTENVTSMKSMFENNNSVKVLDLSGFDTQKVTDMSDMFDGCKWLKTIFVSDKWNTSSVTSSNYMFSGCNNLYGGKGTHYTSSSIDYACIDEEGTPGYFTKAGNKPFESSMAYAKFDEETGTVTIAYGKTIPEGYTEIYTYGGYLGSSIPNLEKNNVEKIVIDESFKNFKATTCYEWFNNYYYLTTIEGLTNINTENVKSLGYMFNGCSLLTSLDLSSFNTKNVDYTANMFYNCYRLKTIYISDKWDMSAVTYANDMFSGCKKLYGSKGTHCESSDIKFARADKDGDPGYLTMKGETPYLPDVLFAKFDKDTRTFTVTYGKEAPEGFVEMEPRGDNFYWFGHDIIHEDFVQKIVIDKSFSNFKPTSTSYWFNSLPALTEFEGANNINTELTTDMDYMFSNCPSLKSIDVSSLNTNSATNMERMFFNDLSLTSLDVSSFKTDLVKNMSGMFGNCINLQTIYVSDKWNTKNIAQKVDMFSNCANLHGSKGTQCNAIQYTAEFAKIDGGESNPGLLTKKGDAPYELKFEGTQPYAVFADGTLTFRYDDKHGADAYRIGSFKPTWNDIQMDVTTVVFDKSFAGFKPINLESWFDNFANLEKIEGIENLNTEDVVTMNRLFNGCTKLTNIDLSKFNTKNVRNMAQMFCNCENLKSLDLKSFTTDSLRTMYSMFAGCKNLISIDLGTFKTDSVKDFSYVFTNCEKLTKLDLSKFNTKEVTSFYSMFGNCPSLTDVNLSSFNSENVSNMGSMFQNCQSLETLDLSSFNTPLLTNISDAFTNCKNLKTIYVSDKWSIDNVYSWTTSYIFNGCENLYGGLGTECNSLTASHKYAVIDGGFQAPGLMTKVGEKPFEYQKETVQPYAVYANGTLTFRYDDKSTAGSYPLPKFNPEWAEIADKITKVVFDKSFKDYKPEMIAAWFNNCTKLTTIEGLEYLNTENVVSMKYMFSNCLSLTSLDLSNFATTNLQNADYMFYNCIKLKTIFVSDKWTNTTIKDVYTVFYNCNNLIGGKGTVYDEYNTRGGYARIDGGKDAPGYFTKAGEEPFVMPALTDAIPYVTFNNGTLTFRYDTKFASGDLKLIEYPWTTFAKDITKVVFDKSFGDYLPADCSHWFEGCENLTEIQGMEYLKTDTVSNMNSMFRYCTKLTNLDLSNLKTDRVTNMEQMFSQCFELTTINLSSANTSKVNNFQQMFSDCKKLKTIIVSDKWTVNYNQRYYHYAAYSMFTNCVSLEGGEGTKYNPSIVNGSYAKIDGGLGNEGYLSKNKVISIEIVEMPKTEYALNETFSAENGTLTVKYINNTTETIALSEATITGFDPTKEGEQTITISYYGATTELKVKVNSSTPVSSIAESNDNIRIWSYGHTLFVENAVSEIIIYNTNGIPVLKQKPTADRVELNISKSGIYIIKTGNKTQKVLIN